FHRVDVLLDELLHPGADLEHVGRNGEIHGGDSLLIERSEKGWGCPGSKRFPGKTALPGLEAGAEKSNCSRVYARICAW
ncbi:MAG: hypothetical protein NZ990_08985, partial [Myxococcota bacterium]|nr:hypothetical protein [Myxococcota bacterium]